MLLAKPVAQPLTRGKKQGNEHTGSSTRTRSKIIERIVHVSYKFWCGNKRLHQIFTPDGGTTPGTPSLSLSLSLQNSDPIWSNRVQTQGYPGCHDCEASVSNCIVLASVLSMAFLLS